MVHSLVVLVWSDHINSSIHNKFWNDTRLLSINSKRWIISKTSPFCYNFSIPWICAWNYDFKQDVKTNTPALIRAFSTKFWQDFSEQQQYKPQLLSWFFGNPQLSKIIKLSNGLQIQRRIFMDYARYFDRFYISPTLCKNLMTHLQIMT